MGYFSPSPEIAQSAWEAALLALGGEPLVFYEQLTPCDMADVLRFVNRSECRFLSALKPLQPHYGPSSIRRRTTMPIRLSEPSYSGGSK